VAEGLQAVVVVVVARQRVVVERVRRLLMGLGGVWFLKSRVKQSLEQLG